VKGYCDNVLLLERDDLYIAKNILLTVSMPRCSAQKTSIQNMVRVSAGHWTLEERNLGAGPEQFFFFFLKKKR